MSGMTVNKADALAVSLDFAEETDEYPDALRERMAKLLVQLRLAPPWSQLNRRTVRGEYALVYRHSGAWTAIVSLRPHGPDPYGIQTRWADEARARAWCDTELRQAGVVLGGLVQYLCPVCKGRGTVAVREEVWEACWDCGSTGLSVPEGPAVPGMPPFTLSEAVSASWASWAGGPGVNLTVPAGDDTNDW